ncbi:MAG: hypothetical protein MR581_06560 [Lachnospiraceae bacterium]|nr:hypothetical protein [Lachnospiraceae bacterium]
MKAEQNIRNQKRKHIGIRMFFFVTGLLLLCTEVSTGLRLPHSKQGWVFLPLFILVLLISVLLSRRGGKFLPSKKFLNLIVFVYVSVYALLAAQLNRMESHTGILTGANANTFSYQNDIFSKGYASVDEIIQNTKLDTEYQEFYRFEDSCSISIFYKRPYPENVQKGSYQEKDPFYMSLKILSLDIYKEKDLYYNVGTREMSTACFSDSYSDEETVRADLSASLSRKSVLPEADTLFAWGFSCYPVIDQVKIDGISCKKIIPFSLRDGSTGYFWLIPGMNADLNPKAVKIQGISNTDQKQDVTH